MESRIVILTGANSGIGRAAAAAFASRGYRVVMACRNLEKSRPVHQQILEETGNPDVTLLELDLASFASVQNFCEQFGNEFNRLDILIHNAGFFNHGVKTYQMSRDGCEKTFAVNVFGPHLLTELLLEQMTRSRDPRVLTAGSSSIKYFFDPKREIEFDNLQGEKRESRPYNSYKMYGDSKMGLFLLTKKMAEEYDRYGIRANTIMIPATRMSRERIKKFRSIYRVIAPVIQNLNPWSLEPEDIAEMYLQLTTDSRFRNRTGRLFDSNGEEMGELDSGVVLPIHKLVRELWSSRHVPPYASDPGNVEKMWEVSHSVIRDHNQKLKNHEHTDSGKSSSDD